MKPHWLDEWEDRQDQRSAYVDDTTRCGEVWSIFCDGRLGYMVEFQDGGGLIIKPGEPPIPGRWVGDELRTTDWVYTRNGRASPRN